MNHPFIEMTDDDLMQLSSDIPELRFERNADGSLIAMPLRGGILGNRIAKVCAHLWMWVEQQNLGEVFSPNAGFRLPNTAIRSPITSFVAKKRLPLNWDQEDYYLPLAPDFVIEMRSATDTLEGLQEKMQEYIENGVKLGWLIDRQNKTAYVYRADGSITQYPESATLSGEDVVPGFTLALKVLL